jgi:hypothetical protein
MIKYTVEIFNGQGERCSEPLFPSLADAAEFLTGFHKEALSRELKPGADYNVILKEYKGK